MKRQAHQEGSTYTRTWRKTLRRLLPSITLQVLFFDIDATVQKAEEFVQNAFVYGREIIVLPIPVYPANQSGLSMGINIRRDSRPGVFSYTVEPS